MSLLTATAFWGVLELALSNSPERVQETPINLYHPDSSNFTRVQQERAGVKRTALAVFRDCLLQRSRLPIAHVTTFSLRGWRSGKVWLFRKVGVSNGSLNQRLVPADSQSRPFVEEAGLRPPAQGCDPALSDNPSPLIQPKCLQCATAVLIPLPRKSGGATLGYRANGVSTPTGLWPRSPPTHATSLGLVRLDSVDPG